MSRPALTALALAVCLACTGSRPEPGAPGPAVDAAAGPWWQGRWRLDEEGLTTPEALAELALGERDIARALTAGLAAAVWIEVGQARLVRAQGHAPRAVGFAVESAGERAILRLEDGSRLQWIHRGEGRATLVEGMARPLPLRRD